MRRRLLMAGVVLVLCAQLASAAQDGFIDAPRFTVEKIIALSRDFAAAKGKRSESFFIDSVRYEDAGKRWVVHFQGFLLAPGNDFLVFVDDRTEQLQLLPGE